MERIAVIGLGRFGERLAALLTEGGAEVIAIDSNRDVVDDVRDKVTLAVCLDGTDEKALRAQGVDKVNVAVVGIGSDLEVSSLTTVILKQIGVPRVIARATTPMHAEILSRIGADDIANPEYESAERWRGRLLAPAILEKVVLAEGYSLVQVEAPESFHGRTLADLNVGNKYNVLVVAIRRHVDEQGEPLSRERVIPGPGPNDRILVKDVLTLVGSDASIAKFPTRK